VATYLYGLVRASAPTDVTVTGIADTPVRTLTCADLTAIVASLDRAVATPTLDTIRAHDAVLQRFVDGGATVVAVRFGQAFDDDAACCAHVDQRGARLLQLFREHDGTVEMRLLLPMREEPPATAPRSGDDPDVPPGRAYLESIRVRTAAMPAVRLRDAMGPIIRAERVEELPKQRGIVFSHLVHRADVDRYRDSVRALPTFATATLVGPLALYSFAEGGPG
jgi:hypothetical protein